MNEIDKLIDAVQSGDKERLVSMLERRPELVSQRDESGATALHHAAFEGQTDIARLLVEKGADINARDGKFNATPAGWAIEYLREMGAFLGIELSDFAHAIQTGNVDWVKRYLDRFPRLREASDGGKIFRQMAVESGKPEIVKLFR